MSDLGTISDADLLASLPQGIRSNNPLNVKDTSGNFRSFPTTEEGLAAADQNLLAYKTKHGINTIAGVVSRWAPKGDGANDPAAYAAHVSQATGIAPDAQIDLGDPSTRHSLLSAMSEVETGVKTPAKPDLSGISDADLLASLKPATGEREIGASHNRGVTISVGGGQPAPVPAKPQPNSLMDAAQSYLGGLQKGVAGGADLAAAFIPGLGAVDRMLSGNRNPLMVDPLHATGTMFSRMASAADHTPQTIAGQYARTLGQFTPAGLIPGSIPSRVANVVLPAVSSETAGQVAHGMGANPIVEQIARTVGALGGGALASTRFSPATSPSVLPDITKARKAAYANVEQSGDVIPQGQMKDLASQFATLVRSKTGEDPKAYPASMDMLSRLNTMGKAKDGVTLPQLDTLRSDIFDALIKPGDREQPLGTALRTMIDQTINQTGNPDILAARDLYAREQKIKDIMAEVTSAKQRASVANSGQNVNNSMRRELQPFIDPTRNQQMTNLSPGELDAVTTAVQGTGPQNAMRDASNILRNRFLQGVLTVPTAGAVPIAMEVAGRMLNKAAESGTMNNIQKAIALIAQGHAGSAAPPIYPQTTPGLAQIGQNPATVAALLSLLPATTAAKPVPKRQARAPR